MRFSLSMKPLLNLTFWVWLCSCIWVTGVDSKAADRPNFVIFIADDVSVNDFGCYGNDVVKTPNIDKLAAEGMLFHNAYLTISSCSPSRNSIITGRYPHNTGASELHRILPEEQIRFPELLKENGYHTVLSGKVHGITTEDRAFNIITEGGWPEEPSASKDWVQLTKDRPLNKPFLFWFASVDAHRPWETSDHIQQYDPAEVMVPPYMKDDQATREDLAAYYHEISRFDDYIGQVIAVLKEQGDFENTMILVMADNGRPFKGAKTSLYDSGIKTPFVLRYPKLISPSKHSKSIVSAIDIAPTILEIAGLKIPEQVQGVSFKPILHNEKASVRDVAFAERNWHVYKSHQRLVRFKNIAYIKDNYPTHHSSGSYNLLHDRSTGEVGNPESNSPIEKLFILDQDPHQITNQANNPEYRSVLLMARRLLEQWTFETGDTVPTNPTPDRDPDSGIRNPHREQPGKSEDAESILNPGPIRITN